jgi:hypothetical protein
MRKMVGLGAVAALATVLLVGLLHAQASARQPVETLDTKGRVVSRIFFNSDGSGHKTLNRYSVEGDKPVVAIEEDFDRDGHTTRRTTELFDSSNRLIERRDVAIDGTGHESGTLTTFTYDAAGRQTESTTPIP